MYMMMISFLGGGQSRTQQSIGRLLFTEVYYEYGEVEILLYWLRSSALILVISVHLFDDLFFLLCKEGRS